MSKDTTALTVVQNDAAIMPVMDIQMAVMRRQAIVSFTKQLMVDGTDFGKIPGTGDKPTLLKPGAEKLLTLFGLTPTFTAVEVVEDWTGAEHGEPLFYYRYRCELYKGGNLIAGAEGSCNSWEKKYRYRKAERVCPVCDTPAIIKGKTEYGGGWLCFKNKGGCGAKFKDDDSRIKDQQTGYVPNPDVADLLNTIQKMSQKRALVAATLLAVNASEFFNQDLDDLVDAEYVMVDDAPKAKTQRTQAQEPPVEDVPFMPEPEPVKPKADKTQLNTLHALGNAFYGSEEVWDEKRLVMVKHISRNKFTSSKDLPENMLNKLIEQLEDKCMELSMDLANTAGISVDEFRDLRTKHENKAKELKGVGLAHLIDELRKMAAAQPQPEPLAA